MFLRIFNSFIACDLIILILLWIVNVTAYPLWCFQCSDVDGGIQVAHFIAFIQNLIGDLLTEVIKFIGISKN